VSADERRRQQNSALDSWKAIAAHLQRDEGTLRRWEQTRGLPIRRVPGKKGIRIRVHQRDRCLAQSDPPETTPSATPDPVLPGVPPTVVTTPPRPARRWVVTLAVGRSQLPGESGGGLAVCAHHPDHHTQRHRRGGLKRTRAVHSLDASVCREIETYSVIK
jgi:hypothetical protein